MIEQLKTVREFVESVHEGEWAPYVSRKATLAAIAQIEAAVGSQEPVAWIRGSGIEMLKLENGGCATVYASEGMSNHSSPLYAAPVAQQYEAGDMASAAAQGFRDGVASAAQQPQAEAVRINYFPVYEFAHKHKLLYNEVCAVVRAAMSAPQQAEAVPSDVVRDAAPIPDHELVTMYDERPTSDLEMIEFAREVERRHGIGVQPKHITDGSPCWCNPDVAYADPETGASVIVHRRPQ